MVNLIIHVLAALVLFGLVRRTLLRPVLAERFGSAATALALAVSAIWAWHPVQTESVTYLSQRAESLMGLFYLLTLYCFVRGACDERGGGRIWYPLCVLACLAGVATKEVIVTAPLLVFLYDRTFISGSFSGAWRRHWPVHAALAATWLPLGFLMVDLHHRSVGMGLGVAWWAYGLTECRVVVRYILISFWPHSLVFDYGPYVAVPLSELWPFVLVLASLLAAAVVALRRWPAIGFVSCWFFLILAPASSIVPIIFQPMAENRLYLPLAGVVGLVVLGAFRLIGRWTLLVFAAVAVAAGLASVHRNRVYSSELAIWSDTVAKSPRNARAHNDLGNAFSAIPGRLNDAIAEYEETLRLNPRDFKAHNNLGGALAKMPGRLDDAIAQFEEALHLNPGLAETHNNLGNALAKAPGRVDEAITQYEEALRLAPDLAEAHDNLAYLLAGRPGRQAEAIAHYETALRIMPNYAEAHNNLANLLASQPGRQADAIAEYEAALRFKPDYAEAHFNLANLLVKQPGRQAEAIAQYQEVVRLKPDSAEAHNDLGYALAAVRGRMDEAIAQYKDALRLEPDLAEAHINLGIALASMPGRMDDAIAQFEEALRLKPDYAEAHIDLGNALMTVPGRLDDAISQFEEALRRSPGLANAYIDLGVAYLRKGDFVRALADCNEAMRMQPGIAIIHSLRADAYSGSRDYDHAIADYNEAIRLQPGFAEAYNNLAWLLAACSEERFRNGPKAESFARKACELTEWKNPDYVDTLAVACAEAGDFGEAVKWENTYLEFNPPKESADSARQRLSLFAAKKAYHEGEKPN
ncbi:MAG: tetratricopeptide repeat protein [Opitutaceae bacterium]